MYLSRHSNLNLMKKPLLKSLSVLSCTLMLGIGGCTTDFTDDPQVPNLADETIGPKTRSLESAIFNEGAQVWMVPQKDPYTLANFQQAYENLLSGNTAQPLTRSEIASIADAEPLKATHYCLKIYPKDEHEQWQIERMEDVKVAYIPFDYVQLTEDEIKALPTTRSASALFPDERRYKVTYSNVETSEGTVPFETYKMPILYAVWPIDKPLPEELDYEIDYPIFIPSAESVVTLNSGTFLSKDNLRLLENEAINLALGYSPEPKTRATNSRTNEGELIFHDNEVNYDSPLRGLRIRFQLGSRIWETSTHGDGYFRIPTDVPGEASYIHEYRHSKWKITPNGSTAPISYNYGLVNQRFHASLYRHYVTSQRGECEIHNAACYYYTGEHELHTWSYDDGIRITACDYKEPGVIGRTFWGVKPVYIEIYSDEGSLLSNRIGTTLHELGHFTHYGERGGAENLDNMRYVHGLIKESYACYVGWYLTGEYYQSIGYMPSDPTIDLSTQAHQGWSRTNTGQLSHYSPLFVDLVDDYNQETMVSERPIEFNPDPISGVPHSVIRQVIGLTYDWYSLKQQLEKYIGVYYSWEDYKEFKIPYEYWFRLENQQ